MNYKTKSQLVWGIRILVSGLFILSAIAKLYPTPILGISAFETKYLGFRSQGKLWDLSDLVTDNLNKSNSETRI